ncbi:MAG: enoyl-CoA hydratase/isomerase family protein [Bdellovibrionales bacterium]|nr:enoyl-CoA hydratase/isomerase family protein [Bdellovibrionales bacterium]
MKFLEVIKKDQGVVEVWINRPDLHNAFNAELIEDMITLFESFKDERLIILSGRGSSFCAGADLNWMKAMKDYTRDENFKDAKRLAKMFSAINDCDVPVIGRINGHALGGGVGLVSVCDYVVAVEDALMGFTEVRLGLIPAVISPYCISKVGESNARAWMLSGDRFNAVEAKRMGLVHETVVLLTDLDGKIEEVKKKFLAAGPIAAKEAKKLVRGVMKNLKTSEDFACNMITERRVSAEGQEGMRALLEKDKPAWMKK